jgi:hypothetical protein
MEKKKQQYKLKNWSFYNRALINRGSLTLWIDESMIEHWHQPEKTGYRGSPMRYSDMAIQCGLTLREVFKLPLRATQGFLNSLVRLLEIAIQVPHYSTLSRRQQTLEIRLPRSGSRTPRHLVIDSTGLKVYGEGEWKVRKHGAGKRRTWRKLHVAVDAQSQEVVAVELTANSVGDSEVLPDLLNQLDEQETIETVSADGAYDTRHCHQAIRDKGAEALIPPREGAAEWPDDEGGVIHPRTAIVRCCDEMGKKEWKRQSGYHRRSLAETAMFRIKALFSDKLKNRTFAAQQVEAYLRIGALNKMTGLGMPESYPIS